MEAKNKKADIVIAEDDIITARLQKYHIEKVISRPPVVCSNGKEAIKLLDELEPEKTPALVFLDLNMPIMDGWEFLETCRTKKYYRNTFVVIITSSDFQEDQKKALQYEQVIGYYTKPMKKEQVQEVLLLPEVADIFRGQLR